MEKDLDKAKSLQESSKVVKAVEVKRRSEQVGLVEAVRRPADPGSLKKNIETPKGISRKSHLPAWLILPPGSHARSIADLSDEELYKKCRECGQNAKGWSRRFAALLPEVVKRGLHRRKRFVSIGEFAGKVAGMSEYAVDRVLQLHAKIKDKPFLLKLFESAAEGWSKVEVVAYVATTETDRLWAEKIPLLSRAALSELVKSYRLKSPASGEPQSLNLFSQGAAGGEVLLEGALSSVPVGEVTGSGGMNYSGAYLSGGTNESSMSDRPGGVNCAGASQSGGMQLQDVFGPTFEPPVRFSFPASREVEFDLRLAKQKLEKQTKQVLSWNETFQLIIKNSRLEGGLSGVSGTAGVEKSPECTSEAGGGGNGLAWIGGAAGGGQNSSVEELCKKCAKKQGVFKICEECSRKM